MSRMLALVTTFLLFTVMFASSALAVDYKIRGIYDFNFESKDHNFNNNYDDNFQAFQRIRLQLEAHASENLSGTVQWEMGNALTWGKAADGMALGGDGKTVAVRYAYIDWLVPITEIKLRLGLQPFLLPRYVRTAVAFPVPRFLCG